MDLSKTRLDVDRGKQGEWVRDIPGLGDIELKVRGSNSPAFRLAMAKAQRAIPREARRSGGFTDPEAADAALGQALAEGALLDWRNVSLNGEGVDFSIESARALLSDPAFGIFRDGVAWAADEVARLVKEGEDESLGK